MKDNFGSVIVNGENIDLNSESIDNLKKILADVENQEKELANELNIILQELA